MTRRIQGSISIANLWGMGFRPFFWAGSVLGIVLMSLWILIFAEQILGPDKLFVWSHWHAHEMVFGFVLAIVIGFLLTASANWTQTRGLNGRPLMALFSIWAIGRILMISQIFSSAFAPLASAVDLAFLPVSIALLSPPLLKAGQLRNISFIALLSLLWIANLLMHLAAFDLIAKAYSLKGLYLGVHIILFIVIVVGGRVVPFFTQNALPHVQVKRYRLIESATLILTGGYIFLDFFLPEKQIWTGILSAILSIVHLIRLFGWKPYQTFRNPLLWILHTGYLWVVVGFLLVALSDLGGLLSSSAALHAWATGTFGVFIIGMISRVSLGHSGRLLELAPGMLWSYVVIQLAALLRVSAAFFSDLYLKAIVVSGILWMLAFSILLSYYWRIYFTPRADGRPG